MGMGIWDGDPTSGEDCGDLALQVRAHPHVDRYSMLTVITNRILVTIVMI
jgi:hypothetical protein